MMKINLHDALEYKVDGRRIWVKYTANHEAWMTLPRASRVSLMRRGGGRGSLHLGSMSKMTIEIIGEHTELAVLAGSITEPPRSRDRG